jgi:glucose-1-phosphate adenylyltransferase
MKTIKSLILGGGQGTRLYPLTKYRSKAAVPIGGKYRLVDIPVSNCLHSGIKDIYVITQFNSESLNNHINNTYRFDYFSRAFVKILAAEQTTDNTNWLQGTADAVRKNLMHLSLKGDEDVLILSGDHIYKMDYRELIDRHRRTKADITLSVFPIGEKDVKEFGILKMNRQGKINGFKEKPKKIRELKGFDAGKTQKLRAGRKGPVYLASMGVYVFKAHILKKALNGDDVDFGHEVIPNSIDRFNVYGFVFDGYWKDVGTIKSFYEENIKMAVSKPLFSLLEEPFVFTHPRFLPPVKISGCKIERSLIADGCVIGNSEIKNSVIGLRTVIGKNCRIKDTFIMGADFYDEETGGSPGVGIGDGTVIEKAIIDKNARIGKNVVIKNPKRLNNHDGDGYFIRDGITIITKEACLKNGTRI